MGMKVEEAIEILKQNKEIMEMISPPDKQTESLMLAIQALEKQVAKKPKTDANRILCCNCNTLMAYNESLDQHCWVCGQNLERSED